MDVSPADGLLEHRYRRRRSLICADFRQQTKCLHANRRRRRLAEYFSTERLRARRVAGFLIMAGRAQAPPPASVHLRSRRAARGLLLEFCGDFDCSAPQRMFGRFVDNVGEVFIGVQEDTHVATVTDLMAETMVNWGVEHVFGMVGHSNLGLADDPFRRGR